MRLIQEIDESDWKPMHRLVYETRDGKRIEGEFAPYEEFAILSDDVIAGSGYAGAPHSGYLATTEYFEGVMPRLTRFQSPEELVFEQRNVEVLGRRAAQIMLD